MVNYSLVVFDLGSNFRCSLYLTSVSRIVRVVAITPLPKAPSIVLGAINIEGQVLPVVSLNRRFGLPEPPLELDQQIIVAQTPRRAVGILVPSVSGLIEIPETHLIRHSSIVPGLEYVEGIAKLDDGMVCIHDLASCLSLDEERALDESLEAGS